MDINISFNNKILDPFAIMTSLYLWNRFSNFRKILNNAKLTTRRVSFYTRIYKINLKKIGSYRKPPLKSSYISYYIVFLFVEETSEYNSLCMLKLTKMIDIYIVFNERSM